MAFSPTTSWQTEVGKVKAVTDFLFLGSKITVDGDCSHEVKRSTGIYLIFFSCHNYDHRDQLLF